jgi:UDP-Gal:alpha-D-GlcNAc-diphosphoundecaprenol beta-1,4-galactosyltransferase
MFADDRVQVNVFINHYSLFRLEKAHVDLLAADRLFVDGMLLARQMGTPRCPVAQRAFDASSIAVPLARSATARGFALVFVGGSAEESLRFGAWLREQLPAANVFTEDGFSGRDDAVLDEVLRYHKKLMIVYGTGTPKQEQQAFAAATRCRAAGVSAQVFTCGGFISQTAGSPTGTFYPAWVRRFGLRWVWRCYRQPFVIKRLLSVYPRAVVTVTQRNRASSIAPDPGSAT